MQFSIKNQKPNQKIGQRPKQTFLQRHRDSSTPLIIREMHIKTTMRDHLTVVRVAIIKKSMNRIILHFKVLFKTIIHTAKQT